MEMSIPLMRYVIDVWLENGEPQLGLIDRESCRLCCQWRLCKQDIGARSRVNARVICLGMQELVRNMFLISCCEELKRAPVITPEQGRRLIPSQEYEDGRGSLSPCHDPVTIASHQDG